MRTCFVGALLLSAAVALPALGQTLDEVRQAVEACVGLDEHAEVARQSLTAWGNSALPMLRSLAGKPEDATLLDRLSPSGSGGLNLVCAIQLIDTPEAVDLLVEILDNKTLVAPHYALTVMQESILRHREQLDTHKRFQQLIFKFAKDGDGPLSDLAREDAARIIADMRWEDGVPLLELMLHDDDLSVRSTAATALTELTGKPVDVAKPRLAFPHAADRNELSLLVSVGNDDLRGRLDTWFDGAPALIQSSGTNLQAVDCEGIAREILDPGFDVADVLSLRLADRSLRWVFLADKPGHDFRPFPEFAVCVDDQRRELWRYSPAGDDVDAMCRLYGESGPVGVAFGPGGEEGVVAFDFDGHEIFRVPRTWVTYGLSSNPRVPGLWLHCGGDLELYDNLGHRTNELGFLQKLEHFYAEEAVLATDDDARPIIVAAGSGPNSTPMIRRCDEELHEVWRATSSDRITSLALLEPPQRSALLAATTEGGELLVFDLDGGLHQRLVMPHGNRIERGGDVATYSISAGPLPDGGYGLAVGLLTKTLLYAVK